MHGAKVGRNITQQRACVHITQNRSVAGFWIEKPTQLSFIDQQPRLLHIQYLDKFALNDALVLIAPQIYLFPYWIHKYVTRIETRKESNDSIRRDLQSRTQRGHCEKGMLSPAGVQRSHKRRHILLVCLHSECKMGIINRLTSGGQQHSSTSPRGWGLVGVGWGGYPSLSCLVLNHSVGN